MTGKTISQMIWPRPGLAGCIFCAIVRDTRGAMLDQSQRFNFFPASPLCCVTSIVEGDLHQISSPEQMKSPWMGEPVPRLAFSGAQLGPLVSWSPGEVYVITVAFYPDAFSRMTGIDLSAWPGRMAPAGNVIPEHVLQPCQDFFDHLRNEDTQVAFARLQTRLEAVWSTVRPEIGRSTRRLTDWTMTLVARAALSGPGKSARQIARRVKSWTGVNERALKSLGQTERLYANIHEAIEKDELDWAGLATASGFADQPHMIRRMRKHTGFTPEQLRQLVPSEEALWGYRLLGEYFSRPH